MSEKLLSCAVFKGMFSDELAVRYPPQDREGTQVSSFFVPRDHVLGQQDGFGRVRVKVYREGGTVLAVLPNENATVIPVDDADLSNP